MARKKKAFGAPKHKGRLINGICPVCKGNTSKPTDTYIQNNSLTRTYTCSDCGSVWEDTVLLSNEVHSKKLIANNKTPALPDITLLVETIEIVSDVV